MEEAVGAGPEGETDAGPPERHISMLNPCRRVEEYEKLSRISEGTYGVVYKCAPWRYTQARELASLSLCCAHRYDPAVPVCVVALFLLALHYREACLW